MRRNVHWRGYRPVQPGLGITFRGRDTNMFYWGVLALLAVVGIYGARLALGVPEDQGVPAAWEL